MSQIQQRSGALPGDELKSGLVFVLVFLLLAAGIVSVGIFYYRNIERQYRAEVERQLSAIADLKVAELAQWRNERLADGLILFQNVALSNLVRRLLEKPEGADAQRQLLVWFGKYGTHYRYDEVRLLDAQGVTRLSWPAGLPAVTPEVAEHASEARRLGQVMLQDFYRSTHDQQIRLAILIPILDEADGNRTLGVFVLRIDPEAYLYPFIQRWPTFNKTPETLLLRRDGNDVLYLNDLRHRTNTALALRIPLTKTEVPAVRAALGQTGIMPGADYRGVPVLAVGRAIPDSPWFLIAKIDVAEVYAPLRAQLRQVIVMIGILIFGAGAAVGLIWRQQGVRRLKERAELSDALGASSAYSRSLIEASLDPLVTISPEGRITDVNEGSIKVTGVPREKLIGADFLDYFTEPDKAREGYQEVFAKGFVTDYPLTIRHKDGRLTDVLYNASVYKDARGTVLGVFAAARDVTKGKQAEAALQASEAKFRTLAESVQVGIVAHAPDTSILLSNPMATEILGLTSDQMRGKKAIDPAWRFIREDGTTLPLAEYPVNRVLAEEMPIVGLVLGVIRPDRELPTWVECSARKIWGPTGELEQVIVVFADVTERKKAEQALVQSRKAALNMMTDAVEARDRVERLSKELEKHRDHLEQLVAERTADLARRSAELDAANRELDAFSHSVSHDLRAPLRGIDGWSLALLEDYGGQLDEQGRTFLGRVRAETQRMGALVDDLLQLSRLSRTEMRRQPVDLSGIARMIAARLRESAPDRAVEFIIQPDLIAQGDAPLLEVALTNLLGNAFKFTGKCAQARIEFGMSKTLSEVEGRTAERGVGAGTSAVYYVRDNGAGFDMAYAKKLFGAFQRMHKTSDFPGTGIGLATVQRIVHRHGGRVWAEAAVNQGATLFFTLGEA